MAKKEKRKVYIGIRWKMLILFTLLFTIIFGGAFYWFYTFSTRLAMDELYTNLLATANVAASKIDGDVHQALFENPNYDAEEGWPAGMTDERFWEMAEWLNQVYESSPRSRIYTYTSPKEGVVEFVVSMGAVWDPVAGAPFGYLYEPQPPSVILSGLKEETLSTNFVEDEFGTWISGFVPIKDSVGEIVAAVGVDYEASGVIELQKRIKSAAIPAFAITYAVLLVSVLLISNQIAAPIIALTSVAEQISEGDYTQAELKDRRITDEVTILTRVFNMMVEKVEAREKRLKKQVAELQIVIDEQRKQEEIAEITDTDFFQTLQAKAKERRAQHQALLEKHQ